MGTSRHLLVENGKTWLEKTIELLKQVTQKVVTVGDGTVPEIQTGMLRLPDAPDFKGPKEILSAMRWEPYISWLVTACDMPELSLEALK